MRRSVLWSITIISSFTEPSGSSKFLRNYLIPFAVKNVSFSKEFRERPTWEHGDIISRILVEHTKVQAENLYVNESHMLKYLI